MQTKPLETAAARKAPSGFGSFGNDVGPALNRLSRLPHCFGEGILFVEALQLAAFIELDKMPQCAAGPEQLALGVHALDIGSQSFGHGTTCYNSVVQIVSGSRKNA